MNWAGVIALLLLVGAVCGLAWIRLAPDDVARWHHVPEAVTTRDMDGGVIRIVPGALAELNPIIRQTPRTRLLAGSVQSGMVTYITRSKLFGFPDYTTVAQRGDDLILYARLRYGKSDMGVNKARVDHWLSELAQE
ncbi:DUF1499 domain-containing protein [Roseovarius dicentrarchi]|uniref:DUF1499 domain-containing protein n=1 Tax=Roseovarius dicentrarchi TaxID=2250573 RepID=UPI000DEA7B38|nr:DUF1499 domain-containing protein [Roseovarius dicentrarchi]